MKRLTLIFAALSAALAATVGAVFPAAAQSDVTFEVVAPTAVEMGEPFSVEFVVNTIKDVEFTPLTIEGFDVLAGPTSSTSWSGEIINGKLTRTETTAYTYILQGSTVGLQTIPAARVTVKGKSYSTKPMTIEVVSGGAGASGGSGQGNGGSAGQGGAQTGAPEVSDADIFLRAVVSRHEVYKNEPVAVALKLYSRVHFGGFEGFKIPSFNGFWMQDITPAAEPSWQRETSGNRAYNTVTLKEYLLYPQQSGTLTIEPFEATAVVQFPVNNPSPRNIFDAVMGMGNDFRQVLKKISSAPEKIVVRDWPEQDKPAIFEGAVGEFKLDATPPPSRINANTSGTYTLRLSGTGNFPLIGAPRLTLPASFEEYNVTTSDNTRNTRTGTSGYREFSYPFIARTDGLYTIPAFEFSYFNPRLKRYETLSSREISMEVAADTTAVTSAGGLVSGLSREELKIFDRDIQFIKRGAAGLRPKGRVLLWSPLHISLMALLVVASGVGFVLLRRYIRNMQSDRFVRGKRANKVALRRFRAAEASMKQGDKHGFHDEMLKALWGYMGDKLDIPMAALTKERIREELFERSIPEARGDEYIRIISECEEAQYSPASSARMGELYREGVALVSELESAIKR